METGQTAGWYTDPQNPHVRRYWDGEKFTHYQADQGGGPGVGAIAGGVLLGVLGVVVVLFVLWQGAGLLGL